MARCLIIGCGCRGQALSRELVARGNAVRATTRDPAHVGAIEAAGAEAVVGDPDRVATIAPAFEHVGAAVILLGSAVGTPEALAALHGSRLDMLLLRMLDSTVRGIVYEAVGILRGVADSVCAARRRGRRLAWGGGRRGRKRAAGRLASSGTPAPPSRA